MLSPRASYADVTIVCMYLALIQKHVIMHMTSVDGCDPDEEYVNRAATQ